MFSMQQKVFYYIMACLFFFIKNFLSLKAISHELSYSPTSNEITTLKVSSG